MGDEADRISRVYRGYAASDRGRRYDQTNRGNRAIVAERLRLTRRLLRRAGLDDLTRRPVLDVGCGNGNELARMQELGAPPSALLGIDLLPDRIELARRDHPDIEFRTGDASRLDLPDASFDLVLSMTVLSSVLDSDMARQIAGEMARVLRPGGAVLWYDLRVDNPGNPDVRGLPEREVRELFPTLRAELRPATLAPPLARRLGPLTPVAYPALAALPFLRSHLLGLLIKP